MDYESQVPSLRRILDVSEKTAWVVNDIEWRRHLSHGDYGRILDWQGALRSRYVQALGNEKKEQLARQFVAFEFSQTLHGEQCAMMVAAQLVGSMGDLDARLYAANQTRDEARHVEALLRTVKRLGPIYPVRPAARRFVDDLVNCPLWPKQVLGLQLFLEARALLDFRQHLLFIDDAVFRDAIRNIERDESQHVAFGIQYIGRGVSEMTAAQREEIIQYGVWLDSEMWHFTRPEEYRVVFDECDLDFDEFVATYERPGRLRPSQMLSSASAKSLELFHVQFRRWFFGALNRSGLSEVIERRVGRTLSEEERNDVRILDVNKLPWVEEEEVPAKPARRRRK